MSSYVEELLDAKERRHDLHPLEVTLFQLSQPILIWLEPYLT